MKTKNHSTLTDTTITEGNRLIKYIGNASFEPQSGFIFGGDPEDIYPIAEVRGWGKIQNMFKRPNGTIDEDAAMQFQDSIKKFIADAINEKVKSIQP